MSADKTDSPVDTESPAPDFPVAGTKSSMKDRLGGLSRMWVVTFACVALAIGLTWYSIESPGPEIVIHFAEGHGLKAGDSLRHRGIDIGHVSSVTLDPEMSGIDVKVELHAAAAEIASEGSRFWVVRPQFDLTGVSGLETAVGSKYIAVIPGESRTRQTEFDGLNTRPPDGMGQNGIEVVLRGDERYGVNPGSPVTWRGVEVGQVMASNLSADALHVDTRVRIMEIHRRLISRESKFWVTSGVRMKLGVTGMEVDTETLDEIARGGIAFITPGNAQSDGAVHAGDIFTLHAKLDDEWIASAAPLNLLKSPPPAIASVVATWKQKHFGITRTHHTNASALTIAGTSGLMGLVPTDLITTPDKAIADSYQMAYQLAEEAEILLGDASPANKLSPYLALVPLDPSKLVVTFEVTRVPQIRVPESPEDCFVIRRSRRSGSESEVLIETIEKHQLSEEADLWRTSVSRLSRDTWHGATVLSAADEKIIGLLFVNDDGASVATIPAALFE